jgi:quinoprotein glucose dehydrogenase
LAKDGAVNLREGLGRDPGDDRQNAILEPGKVFENLIILGSAPGENYMAPAGDLRAFDVVTASSSGSSTRSRIQASLGYETWPPDAWKYIGGVNTWGEITVDPVRGIAYFPLGSPTYDFLRRRSPRRESVRHVSSRAGTSAPESGCGTSDGAPRFVGLRQRRGPAVDHDQAKRTTIDVVAQAGKTGFLYVFDRVTGEPIVADRRAACFHAAKFRAKRRGRPSRFRRRPAIRAAAAHAR